MIFRSFGTFLFRTPYFPYSALSDSEMQVQGSVFKEMLQIATPDLSEGMDNGAERAQFSAYRYFERACTRSTPFGLFAGCSMGVVGEQTQVQLCEQAKYRRVTRLDMNYICALTQQIERNGEIREQLRYCLNSSAYRVWDNHRYVECRYHKARRSHQITQLENSDYLQRILTKAGNGTVFAELAALLVDEEINIEEATAFIHELVDAQILVSELDPAVTNTEPLITLIAKLNEISSGDMGIIDVLSGIDSQLKCIDGRPIGSTGDIYPEIIKNVERTKIDTEIKYLFQADMFKPVEQAIVSRGILDDIQQALSFLNKVNSPVARGSILQFKENFTKRYGEREMPLLFVLDSELGIGYAGNTSGDMSPLVDNLVIPRGNPSAKPQPSIQSILMQKFWQSSQKVIELTDGDVKDAEAVWDDFPPTIMVMCQLLQDDDAGRSFYLQSAGGSSAANLLGRFCHLDEHILNHTLAITQKEVQLNPDVIYAEIVHLPESRIGNILLRPVLRPYEIPYLAKSGVSEEFELRPEDLSVTVKNNRIILRSKRLDKEIVPRMSTAHNYSGQNSMPVYHFLCDLQHQNGRMGVGFSWNEMAQQLAYLPRVIYKNCILSQARWMVREKEIKIFFDIKDDAELLTEIKEWQNKREIPDNVLLSDGDNELYINMNHPISIRSWLSVVKKRSSFHLKEFLFNPDTAIVRGPEGVFTNEFIFAFHKENSLNDQ